MAKQTEQPKQPEPLHFGTAHQMRVEHRSTLFFMYALLWNQFQSSTNVQDRAALSKEIRENLRELRRLQSSIDKKEARDVFDRTLAALVTEKPCATTKTKKKH